METESVSTPLLSPPQHATFASVLATSPLSPAPPSGLRSSVRRRESALTPSSAALLAAPPRRSRLRSMLQHFAASVSSATLHRASSASSSRAGVCPHFVRGGCRLEGFCFLQHPQKRTTGADMEVAAPQQQPAPSGVDGEEGAEAEACAGEAAGVELEEEEEEVDAAAVAAEGRERYSSQSSYKWFWLEHPMGYHGKVRWREFPDMCNPDAIEKMVDPLTMRMRSRLAAPRIVQKLRVTRLPCWVLTTEKAQFNSADYVVMKPLSYKAADRIETAYLTSLDTHVAVQWGGETFLLDFVSMEAKTHATKKLRVLKRQEVTLELASRPAAWHGSKEGQALTLCDTNGMPLFVLDEHGLPVGMAPLDALPCSFFFDKQACPCVFDCHAHVLTPGARCAAGLACPDRTLLHKMTLSHPCPHGARCYFFQLAESGTRGLRLQLTLRRALQHCSVLTHDGPPACGGAAFVGGSKDSVAFRGRWASATDTTRGGLGVYRCDQGSAEWVSVVSALRVGGRGSSAAAAAASAAASAAAGAGAEAEEGRRGEEDEAEPFGVGFGAEASPATPATPALPALPLPSEEEALFDIRMLERIENKQAWSAYIHMRQCVASRRDGVHSERILYHAAVSDEVPVVVHNGFANARRQCGPHDDCLFPHGNGRHFYLRFDQALAVARQCCTPVLTAGLPPAGPARASKRGGAGGTPPRGADTLVCTLSVVVSLVCTGRAAASDDADAIVPPLDRAGVFYDSTYPRPAAGGGPPAAYVLYAAHQAYPMYVVTVVETQPVVGQPDHPPPSPDCGAVAVGGASLLTEGAASAYAHPPPSALNLVVDAV